MILKAGTELIVPAFDETREQHPTLVRVRIVNDVEMQPDKFINCVREDGSQIMIHPIRIHENDRTTITDNVG